MNNTHLPQFVDPATTLPPGFQSLGHQFSYTDAKTLLSLCALAQANAPLSFPRDFQIAEVGSFVGLTTLLLTIYASPTKLYAIDSWKGSPGIPSDPINKIYNSLRPDAIFQTFLDNTRQFNRTIVTINIPSPTAANFFPNSSLDIVFLDADHSTPALSADILAWKPKLKPHGVLAGHDLNSFPSVNQTLSNLNLPFHSLPISSIWWLLTHNH